MLSFLSRKKPAKGLVGLSRAGRGLALAGIAPLREGVRLAACEILPGQDAKSRARLLGERVDALELTRARCNVVLAPEDYKLLLVEAPRVEPEEMAAAVRWRIKDLVEQPLEDLVTDVFPVPSGAYRSRNEMVYVVAARKTGILQMRDLVTEAGLSLETIDIPEMAMRNLSSFCSDDSNGLAFLHLTPDSGILNLSRGGDLYLTRHLNTHIDPALMGSSDWSALMDRLVLEIQRSLDYYESQMGQGPIPRLLVSPQASGGDALARELDQAMAVRVEILDLPECLPEAGDLDAETRQNCLTAIGGALRRHMETAVRSGEAA